MAGIADDASWQGAGTSDISTAAALRAQYAIETPKVSRRRRHKKVTDDVVDEILIDNTAKLTLHSKKTERLQKRQQKRSQKAAIKLSELSLLGLPAELLLEIVNYLRPSDIFRLLLTCHGMREVIIDHEDSIAKEMIARRYWTLYRCLPLPVALQDVPEESRNALLSEKRQEILNNHRKYYNHHIQMFDHHQICTCMTCIFAWNNLCLILDLSHWQYNLDHREPIPMISRGSNPQWNQDLLQRNADIVREAMTRPLVYAFILEKHLSTIISTILRFSRWKKKGQKGATPRLYKLTDKESDQGNDLFLDRKGPPSYEPPFHRDNYYLIEAYLPNRKWSPESQRWYYYALPPTPHERDVDLVKSWMRGSKPAKS